MFVLYIPDKNFKEYLIEKFDKDGDGEISIDEALAIESIHCTEMNIESLEGIESLSNLKHVNCKHNNIKELDLSNNSHLISLDCAYNRNLLKLNIKNCTQLEKLIANYSVFESLDLSDNCLLKELNVSTGSLKSLNLDHNTKLKTLLCYLNPIERLDVSNNLKLTELNVKVCRLTSLNVSENKELERLICGSNYFEELDLSLNEKLSYVDIRSDKNRIISIKINTSVLKFLINKEEENK